MVVYGRTRYVTVEVYGVCGSWRCARAESDRCRQVLNNHYKFYLSFENSNCDQYITEKFFDYGLRSVSYVISNALIQTVTVMPYNNEMRTHAPHTVPHNG